MSFVITCSLIQCILYFKNDLLRKNSMSHILLKRIMFKTFHAHPKVSKNGIKFSSSYRKLIFKAFYVGKCSYKVFIFILIALIQFISFVLIVSVYCIQDCDVGEKYSGKLLRFWELFVTAARGIILADTRME